MFGGRASRNDSRRCLASGQEQPLCNRRTVALGQDRRGRSCATYARRDDDRRRQVGILTLIVEFEPMTQRALSEAPRVDCSAMVVLVDDLEHRGYVTRQRHPRDRRAFLIQPSETGQAAKVAAISILDEQTRVIS
jgi:MarR family